MTRVVARSLLHRTVSAYTSRHCRSAVAFSRPTLPTALSPVRCPALLPHCPPAPWPHATRSSPMSIDAIARPPVRDHVPVPSAEYFDVLSEDGRPLGRSKLRAHVHRDGDWHRAVHVWVVHLERRQILIQLRAACKDSWASHWDVGCAGHLSAGEVSEAAAAAELEEELGLRARDAGDPSSSEGRLLYVCALKREVISQQGRFIDREWVDVYLLLGRVEADAMRLQEEEVEAVRYIDVDEYVAKLEQGEPGYVPFPDLPVYRTAVFDVIKRTLQQRASSTEQ